VNKVVKEYILRLSCEEKGGSIEEVHRKTGQMKMYKIRRKWLGHILRMERKLSIKLSTDSFSEVTGNLHRTVSKFHQMN